MNLEKNSRAEAQICSQILETENTIASLELGRSTLTETWEVIQQERPAWLPKFRTRATRVLVQCHKTGQDDRKHVMDTDDQEEVTAKLKLAKCNTDEKQTSSGQC
ncbi:unnamed protein product [Linum trigynum]|uniref:Uncharacterized protein n=1 Tax=Linum trigynum TaxID=586398 RepID=A0AAV2ENV3_9ROSI